MKKKLFLFSVTALLFTTCACSPFREKVFSDSVEMMVFSENSDTGANAVPSEGGAKIQESIPPKTSATYNENHTITVNSSEQISIAPDIAQIVYAINTQKPSAADCQKENTASVTQVIELLKKLGIKETSIQTSDYYMHPVYNYSGNTARITGYEAVTSLTVSDLPINELDDILAESVSTGINTVQSITYMASGYDQSYQDALTLAVGTAYQKAQVLAAASGTTVGPAINIQETSGYSQARYTDYARSNLVNSLSSAKEESLMDTANSIMPGEITVEASILVEYQLLQP